MKKNILITGPPASGKSTLIRTVIQGKSFGGIITPEIKRNGERWGFKVVDLRTEKEATFASVEIKPAVVSKYGLDLEAFEKIALPAIEWAMLNSDIVVIDEIGLMECKSEKFKYLIEQALGTKKVLATISFKSKDPFIEKIKNRKDVEIFYLTKINFGSVLNRIKEKLKF